MKHQRLVFNSPHELTNIFWYFRTHTEISILLLNDPSSLFEGAADRLRFLGNQNMLFAHSFINNLWKNDKRQCTSNLLSIMRAIEFGHSERWSFFQDFDTITSIFVLNHFTIEKRFCCGENNTWLKEKQTSH